MADSPLSQRLEEIRRRFASKLDPKFEETDASLPLLTGEGASVVEAVSTTYRRFHEICGTGRTLGFSHLGAAAGVAETILLEPFRAGRGLTDREVLMLKQALEALRSAARIELKEINTDREYKS